ncbi:hypothetical protein AAON49_05380 [Pseudotenacibaculum sp. MALMAid0570]|uniref:hypothetical protein n=1 Tax=Pseudotenacibaculum sp. MALMAid0570 TaxID=3143938 RepID=UPI0032E0565C
MKSLIRESQKKIAQIEANIQNEKYLLRKNRENIFELNSEETRIQQKFLKIKLEILDIHFTLKEICKFI